MARHPVGPTAGRGQVVPTAPVAPAQTMLTNALLVPLDQLAPDPGQPRRHFDETGLAELAESIRQDGVLQPLLVYEDGTLDDGRIRYRILDGERRYRASSRVRQDAPVIAVPGRDVTYVRIQQLVANLQREELDPLEEALALKQLMQLAHLSLAGVADRIGKPRVYVQRRTDLLFDPRLSDAVRRGEINASVAVELKRFPDEVRQQYLDRVAGGERLAVTQLRQEKRRARAILFGQGTVADRQTQGDDRSLPGPRGAPLYRINTDTTATDQQETRDLSGRPPDEQVYRIDTDSTTNHVHTTGQSTAPSALRATPRSDATSLDHGGATVARENADMTEWAAVVAEALLQAGEVTPHGGLIEAVMGWRAAGRPAGWGDALLGALDARIL